MSAQAPLKRNNLLLHVTTIALCVAAAALLALASRRRPAPGRKLQLPGSLQRRQVDYFGAQLLAGWAGIEGVSRTDVARVVAAAKKHLLSVSPQGGFSANETWTRADELALQRMLDAGRQLGDSFCAQFPGDVHSPLGASEAWTAVKEARRRFKQEGGTLQLEGNMLLAWAMKESSWNACGSPYAATRGKSTAVGLLMITRTTYDEFARKGLLGKDLAARWDEAALSDPVTNLTAAQFILQNGPGKTLREKLACYYDPGDPAAGRRYADKVLAGKAYLDRALRKQEMTKMSARARRRLMATLDNVAH